LVCNVYVSISIPTEYDIRTFVVKVKEKPQQQLICFLFILLLLFFLQSEILCLQKPFAKYNRSLHKILVCENHGRPYPSMDVPWNSRDLLKRAWSQNSFDRPTMREIYDELCPMIEIVEQQALPITERSLRAVLEISELFVFDNNDNCNNRTNPLDGVASPDLQRKYSSSSQKTTTTRLSVSTMIGSDIAPE